MKRIYFTFSFFCMCFYSLTLNAQTIANDSIGGIDFYTWAPAALSKSFDTDSPISGTKSLKLTIPTVGEWWTLQVRIETASCVHYPVDFKAGYTYRMTYKIRSTAPETIIHYFHKAGNTVDTQQNVTLAGNNVVETKTFTTPVITQSGGNDFAWYWALGAPGIATTITIDDIVIEEMSTTTDVTNEQADNLTMEVYSTSRQLNIKASANSSVEVLDLTGRTIAHCQVNANETTSIPMSGKSGFVLVRARDAQGNVTIRKAIVQ